MGKFLHASAKFLIFTNNGRNFKRKKNVSKPSFKMNDDQTDSSESAERDSFEQINKKGCAKNLNIIKTKEVDHHMKITGTKSLDPGLEILTAPSTNQEGRAVRFRQSYIFQVL